MSTLSANGFKEASFHVPFSNWDYPKFEQQKWESLRRMAHESYHQDFITDCIAYCDQHGIGNLSDETLQNCFEMPFTGVKVKHHNFEDCYYPVINSDCLDCVSVKKIGTYCYNNGRVVFVYRNGHTYVTKGYKILSELRAAGYKENAIFVPFSNGEEIQDNSYRIRWESIRK